MRIFQNTLCSILRTVSSAKRARSLARRVDCAFLARLFAEHRLEEDDAHDVARALTYDLAKAAYKL